MCKCNVEIHKRNGRLFPQTGSAAVQLSFTSGLGWASKTRRTVRWCRVSQSTCLDPEKNTSSSPALCRKRWKKNICAMKESCADSLMTSVEFALSVQGQRNVPVSEISTKMWLGPNPEFQAAVRRVNKRDVGIGFHSSWFARACEVVFPFNSDLALTSNVRMQRLRKPVWKMEAREKEGQSQSSDPIGLGAVRDPRHYALVETGSIIWAKHTPTKPFTTSWC